MVFFPSYSFLNTSKAAWQKSGTLERLSKKKKVKRLYALSWVHQTHLVQTFFEPESSTDVDKVLQEYSMAVQLPVSFISQNDDNAPQCSSSLHQRPKSAQVQFSLLL